MKNLKIKGPYLLLKKKNHTLLLLGTAHVSLDSVKDVENAFENFKPDYVCVELCEPRHESLLNPEKWKSLDIAQVIKEKKISLLASNLILSSFQKKIGLKLGVQPGMEMLIASEFARKNHIRLFLIDREIKTTLLRAWHSISFFQKIWLIQYLIASLIISEDISQEQIEKLKTKDALEELFDSLPARYHKIKEIVITERDQFMAENIKRIIDNSFELKEYIYRRKETKRKKNKRILAVVGAGHLKGIQKYLLDNSKIDIYQINEIPKPKPIRTLISWVSLTILTSILGYFFVTSGESAKEILLAWAISRSLGAGLGAIIAMAHPLTFLVTIIMAPFSILIPGTRLWMYSSLTEILFHKPKVEDFENIAKDTKSFKDFIKALYKNRVLHLFWIITMVSTGLTIGNLTFLQKLIQILIDKFF